MKVIVAEDAALLREGLTSLLTAAGHEVVAAVGDADEMLSTVPRLPEVELLIADVRMPPNHGDDGLRAAVQVRAERPNLPIMVLSAYVAGPYLGILMEDASHAGVGYLLKERVGRVADFLTAMEVVRNGGVVIDPHVVTALMTVRRGSGGLARLTPREAEVLERMARGESNNEIAAGLVLSPAAVGKHVANIFAKLDLSPDQENRRVRAVLAWLESRG